MLSFTLPLLSVVALSAAQTSTVALWVPTSNLKAALQPGDQADLVASVIKSDATATTYAISCNSAAKSKGATRELDVDPKGPDLFNDGRCGLLPSPLTFARGSSTVAWNYVLSTSPWGIATQSGNCKLLGTTEAACTTGASADNLIAWNFSASTTEYYHQNQMKFTPVPVAAGAVTPAPVSGSMELPERKHNSTLLHTGKGSGLHNASTEKAFVGTGISNIASVTGTVAINSRTVAAKTETPASTHTKSTNVAVQGTTGRVAGAGVLGALVIAVAGAMV